MARKRKPKPEGETVIRVNSRTGERIPDGERAGPDGSIILRGETADAYLDGERVFISGLGRITKDGIKRDSEPEDNGNAKVADDPDDKSRTPDDDKSPVPGEIDTDDEYAEE